MPDDKKPANEEYQSINAELSSKNQQLDRANSDLQNLLESTDIPTIFLDNGLHLKTFTPATRDLFHLRDSDRDRPVTDIVTRLDYADLEHDVKAVLRSLGRIEREVRVEPDDARPTSCASARIAPWATSSTAWS